MLGKTAEKFYKTKYRPFSNSNLICQHSSHVKQCYIYLNDVFSSVSKHYKTPHMSLHGNSIETNDLNVLRHALWVEVVMFNCNNK